MVRINYDKVTLRTDAEMANMSQNALDYQTLVEIANARLKMISTVIGGAAA